MVLLVAGVVVAYALLVGLLLTMLAMRKSLRRIEASLAGQAEKSAENRKAAKAS
jgi:hypothetical protein